MPVQYDSKVVKPKLEHQWTKEMAMEYAKCVKSVKYFILKHCKVPHPTRGIITPDLRDYQMEMLDTLEKNQKSILCVGRQVGKCCSQDTIIRVRNKETGEVKEIKIKDFYEQI
jgi:hypothetical protein